MVEEDFAVPGEVVLLEGGGGKIRGGGEEERETGGKGFALTRGAGC